MGDIVSSFRDLRVYQLAFELQQEVFVISQSFPKEEHYSLTDQPRRASRSVGANIAEAWHKRRYPAHFISKLSDADGEQAETQHWMDSTAACEYITEAQHKHLMEKCLRIGQMLGTMMSEPDKWCRQSH
jgi:four helix bundle protein